MDFLSHFSSLYHSLLLVDTLDIGKLNSRGKWAYNFSRIMDMFVKKFLSKYIAKIFQLGLLHLIRSSKKIGLKTQKFCAQLSILL